MIVKTEIQEKCAYGCGETITIREYIGLEGAWYSDHSCPAVRNHDYAGCNDKECPICH